MQKCGAEATACLTDAACGAIFPCIQACPAEDTACQEACYNTDNPETLTLFLEFLTCVSDNGCV
jgi:hypothetical protein